MNNIINSLDRRKNNLKMIREGIKRSDDTLPRRFFVEKADEKEIPGIDPVRFQKMLDDYYRFSGWDNEGVPTRSKLDELGLAFIAEELGVK